MVTLVESLLYVDSESKSPTLPTTRLGKCHSSSFNLAHIHVSLWLLLSQMIARLATTETLLTSQWLRSAKLQLWSKAWLAVSFLNRFVQKRWANPSF